MKVTDYAAAHELQTSSKINEECDSFDVVVHYQDTITDDKIASLWSHPDGTGRCECSSCMNDYDCCGNVTSGPIRIDRTGVGVKVIQSWYANV